MPNITQILQTMDYGVAPEANDAVIAWLDQHQRRFGHYIGGQFVDATATGVASHFDTVAPASGDTLAAVAQGTAHDVDRAVKAARGAFPSWSALPGNARARYLYAIARLLQKRERFFSVLESMDNGKSIRESRDIDVPLAVRHFYHHAGWADLITSEFPRHQALGVCGQIIPWNFPLLMLAWKIAPALAAATRSS